MEPAYRIPQGIRGIVYSYLDFQVILTQISWLSKSEREFLQKTELLE